MSAYAIVRQAIIAKQTVVATYKGHRREMCPHVIGTKEGEPHALFYQFGGGSSTGLAADGSPENWRCIRIAELSNVTTYSGPWHTAHRHTQRQVCVDQIDVEVAR
jgi:hypothetical protein